MKIVSKNEGVFTFSRFHRPAIQVELGEIVLLETEDAVGGQVKDENTPLEKLDWNRVNKATGPIYVRGVKSGDTLVVDILDIEISSIGVILVVPGAGALAKKNFKPRAKIVEIKDGFAYFDGIKLKIRPMVGTIGVAPEGDDYPTRFGEHLGFFGLHRAQAPSWVHWGPCHRLCPGSGENPAHSQGEWGKTHIQRGWMVGGFH